MWAVQSAVELERLGIPTVAVATDAFAGMGQDTARSQGLAGLPLVSIPQSFEGSGPAEIGSLAGGLYREVVRSLTGDPAELAPYFASREWLSGDDAVATACSIERHAHV